jgi:hypothetical protein
MPQVSENISLIRQRLKEPDPHKPSDHQILNILIEHIYDHCAQLQNTANHWSIGWTQINATPGVEDYAITAGDFGRPFLVYTDDQSNDFHHRREIPFSMLQNVDQWYQGPEKSGSSATTHSACEISFFKKTPSSPSWWARFTPIPGESSLYQVGYEANYEFGSLGDSPGVSSFHHLIRVQTALSVLPLCEWGEMSIMSNPDKWRLQAEALRVTLLHDEEIYQKRFDSYKANSSRAGVSQKRGVGWQYEEEGGHVGAMVDGWGW